MANNIPFEGAPAPILSNGEQSSTPSTDITKTLESNSKTLVERQQLKKKILNFNGSSYSGTDCKVVVHKYNTPTVDLRADLEKAIGVYNQVKDTVSSLALKTVPAIIEGTRQIKNNEISSISYNIVLQEYREKLNLINQLESQIQQTGFMQFIGAALNGQLSNIQSKGFKVIQEFNKIIIFLQDIIDSWQKQADSLSGREAEMISTKVLAELQTISISTFREKAAVRACGQVGVKGYTRGPRTIAGTMVFTVFDRNVLFELLETTSFDSDDQFQAAIKDQLPPLDLTIMFANEYGALSRLSLYGVEFVSEGQSMSIEDIILEDVCQFVARDVDPMTPVVNEQGEPYNSVLLNYNQAVAQGKNPNNSQVLRASDLRGTAWDLNKDNTAESRFKKRSNPFF